MRNGVFCLSFIILYLFLYVMICIIVICFMYHGYGLGSSVIEHLTRVTVVTISIQSPAIYEKRRALYKDEVKYSF